MTPDTDFRLPRIDGEFIGSPTSKALALLRFPLALLIISVHWFVFDQVVDHTSFSHDPDLLPAWSTVCRFVRAFISENGVGTFFFISGYLFIACAGLTRERYKTKVKKRIRSLVIPYVIWNLVMVISITAESVMHQYLHGNGSPIHLPMTVGEFFSGFIVGTFPHLSTLWFIRELITVIILLPLSYPFIKRAGVGTLSVMAAICIGISFGDYPYLRNLSFSLFFFNAGAYLSLRRCDLVRTFSSHTLLFFIAYLLLSSAAWAALEFQHNFYNTIKFVSIFPAVATLLGLSGVLVRKGVTANAFLTASTFFLFAAHFITLDYMRSLLAKAFSPRTDTELTIVFTAGYILLVLLLIGTYALIAHFTPKTAAFLTGKRSVVRKS